ncbi:hypothetical protein TSMEX_008941 [Taenia solium]|eukprot:TsM_000317300 transcript=TsM_000317300 gene=TsM_000317300
MCWQQREEPTSHLTLHDAEVIAGPTIDKRHEQRGFVLGGLMDAEANRVPSGHLVSSASLRGSMLPKLIMMLSPAYCC